MPHYHKLGSIPPKRHTQHRKPDGGLYQEELVSTEGFSNNYSLVYHSNPPTAVLNYGDSFSVAPPVVEAEHCKPRAFMSYNHAPSDDFLKGRKPMMVNNDCEITVCAPKQSMTTYFYKNSSADELIFIHEGEGKMLTVYGELNFVYGDYIMVPRGTIYQLHFKSENNRLLIIESFGAYNYPRRYLSKYGQLMEHAPFCERDIIPPTNLQTHDEKGEFLVYIKKNQLMYPTTYQFHPYGAIGWDGCHYPFIFSIHNFEPITGRVHQPPPIHQTFDGKDFVVCSFVPRKYDYHPLSIPAPYHHANVDSDEVLYYVDGDFMSRNHVEKGMFSLHPIGIPHGPHPGAIERSIGKEKTDELAVMVDTFRPLKLTKYAIDVEWNGYAASWVH
jgi:homogentisate 1,2-dioxygenase